MEAKKIKLSKIKANPENPRVLKDWKFDKLKKSIQDFPEMMQLREIVVDEDMTILGGNMRYRVMQELGIKECPVKIASGLTDAQKKEFIIKDNLAYGEWDMEELANSWDSDLLEEWGFEMPDWGDEEIQDIEEVDNFKETVDFIVECKNLEEFEKLQTKLNIDTHKITYDEFLNKIKL